jgi:asparagine synthase (glutamine-hydrolysing)
MYAIPREQLVRPRQRRSLMRRALAGIVPDELLNRKRKASVARAAMAAFSAERPRLLEISQNMMSETLGIVNPKAFWEIMQAAMDGQEVPVVRLLRTIGVELWLRNLRNYGIVSSTDRDPRSPWVARFRPYSQLRKTKTERRWRQ